MGFKYSGVATFSLVLALATAFKMMDERSTVESTDPSLATRGELLYRGDRPFSGKLIEHYENGVLFRESRYENGLKEGPTWEFALNGRLRELGNYVHGKRDGLQQGWFMEGPERFESHFKDGILDGIQTEWNLNGGIFRRVVYNDGVLTDKMILYPDGEIFTNYAKRDGRIYGIDGGALCMEKKREGER